MKRNATADASWRCYLRQRNWYQPLSFRHDERPEKAGWRQIYSLIFNLLNFNNSTDFQMLSFLMLASIQCLYFFLLSIRGSCLSLFLSLSLFRNLLFMHLYSVSICGEKKFSYFFTLLRRYSIRIRFLFFSLLTRNQSSRYTLFWFINISRASSVFVWVCFSLVWVTNNCRWRRLLFRYESRHLSILSSSSGDLTPLTDCLEYFSSRFEEKTDVNCSNPKMKQRSML